MRKKVSAMRRWITNLFRGKRGQEADAAWDRALTEVRTMRRRQDERRASRNSTPPQPQSNSVASIQ